MLDTNGADADEIMLVLQHVPRQEDRGARLLGRSGHGALRLSLRAAREACVGPAGPCILKPSAQSLGGERSSLRPPVLPSILDAALMDRSSRSLCGPATLPCPSFQLPLSSLSFYSVHSFPPCIHAFTPLVLFEDRDFDYRMLIPPHSFASRPGPPPSRVLSASLRILFIYVGRWPAPS